MSPPINIDGSTVDAITIDGSSVNEVTVDGSAVFAATPNSAILRYPLDDDSDTSTATDVWNSNNGSINGATYNSSSAFGSNALSFDGSNDYVEIGQVATPSSISVLTHANADAADGVYVDLGLKTPTSGGCRLKLLSNSLELIWTDGNAQYTKSGGSAISTTGYEQVGFTIGSDGSYQIIQDNSIVSDGTPASSGLVWAGRTWALGIAAFDLSSDAYDGKMDEVEIVDKVVSSSEITNHKNTGSIIG